ncbi:MAG: HAD family hydrolase [Cyanobacteria bacterium P01_G01_bin.54]
MVTIRCANVTFRNIKAIVFDKDGTLEDSGEALRTLAIKRARLIDAQVPGIGDPLLMAFGVLDNQLDPQGLMAVGSRQESLIGAAAYIAETGRPWPDCLAIARAAFDQASNYSQRDAIASPLFNGVIDVLGQLHQTGLKLAILSAARDEEVQAFVARHQLQAQIAVARGLTDDGLLKPEPALFQAVCQQLNLTPDQVLMVGDSGHDWQMARAAGAAGVVGIRWGNAALVPSKAVDAAIADLRELQVVTAG